ncbi:MAG TPA: hypothetical protein ENK30_04215 [Anaerolineae bacterium]|nr:hypothetical protein [Anaerolineae bacterium]
MRNLFLIIFLCGLFSLPAVARADGGDDAYLYQNGAEITVSLFDNDGQPSFSVTRSDGLMLREPFAGEQFFIDHSGGALTIAYTITAQTGGVDIQYDISNPSGAEQPLPDFLVDGLHYAAQNESDSLFILNTSTHPYLHQRFLNEDAFLDGGVFQGGGYFDINGVSTPYPRIYAPVIAAHDDDFAAGSALLFNYTVDALRPLMRVQLADGRWSHAYILDENSKRLGPGESQQVTLALRFAAPHAWLFTLHPYKTYFDAQFGAERDITPRDTRPISGLNLSYGSAARENYQNCLDEGGCADPIDEATVIQHNLRGYNYYIRLDRDGLDGIEPGDPQFVTTYVQRLLDGGYQRTMLWAMGGQFWDCPPDQVSGSECYTNIPHQFMSDLPTNVENTLDALDKFEQNGIDLGFWWGRAGQVPVPWQWNPDHMIPLDVNDPNHVDPTDHELDLAVARGAKAVGLDAYANIPVGSQLPWLAHLKARAPGVDFWTEGSTMDYLHIKASIFLQPENQWAAGDLSDDEIAQPDLLAQYLNPGAEVIAYIGSSNTRDYIQNLVKWGYTPLIVAQPDIYNIPLLDVNHLDFDLVACFDGVDNDGDGLTDFPYDPGCTSAAGETEVGPQVTATAQGGNVRLSWTHSAIYARYDIWRSESPYFTRMGTPRATVDAAPWQYDDVGALGDPGHNYFYVVQGVAADGRAYANRVGEFDFALTPGGP